MFPYKKTQNESTNPKIQIHNTKKTTAKKPKQKTNNKNSGSQKDINLLCAKKSVPRIDLD